MDGVCKVHDIDMYDGRRYMVMQLLGENLSTLRKSCVETNMCLSWDSTRALGLEMLNALHQVTYRASCTHLRACHCTAL